jgi:hypothetical protein
MFKTLKDGATRNALLAAALFAIAAPAFAQSATEAQKSAIRSACRSDFMSHCASAVRAVEPGAAPKTEAAPAKTEPAPASEAAKPAAEAPKASETKATETKATETKPAAAKQPSSAQVSAIKSACRSDYPKVCAGVPTGGAPALQCLEKNKAKVSPACEKAVTAAMGGGAAATAAAPTGAAAAPTAAPAAAPTVIVLRPLRLREELFIVRSACGGDINTLCAGVAPGGGRIAQCLAGNAASLSPACKDVLAPFAAREGTKQASRQGDARVAG